MKNIIFLSLFLFLSVTICSAKENKFIDGLEDIPLMEGLIQQTENTVSFGNEESRFVEVYLTSSKIGFKKIESFYKDSLPQLGWIYQGSYDDSVIFYRDGESLNFHKERVHPLVVRVTVKNRI